MFFFGGVVGSVVDATVQFFSDGQALLLCFGQGVLGKGG